MPAGACLYQLRHGGAAYDILERKRSFEEVKTRGRWVADSSVRRYGKAGVVQRYLKMVAKPILKFGELAAQSLEGAFRGRRSAVVPPPTVPSSPIKRGRPSASGVAPSVALVPRGGDVEEDKRERRLAARRRRWQAAKETRLARSSSARLSTCSMKVAAKKTKSKAAAARKKQGMKKVARAHVIMKAATGAARKRR